MKNRFLILLLGFSYSVWAQKSAQLDHDKAKKSQVECQRIVDLKLVKSENLKIDCELDNQHFYSQGYRIQSKNPVRIGNFNLLHPGTDKTLFKDISLISELINKEFDVMAAVELMEVVATPRDNNLKLLPLIDGKARDLKVLNSKILSLKERINLMSQSTEGSVNQVQLDGLKSKLAELEKLINAKKLKLAAFSADVDKNSVPGFIILGVEIGKKKRVQRLELALANEKKQEAEIVELKKQQLVLENQIKNSPVSETGSVSSTEVINLKNELSALEAECKNLEKLLSETTRYYRIPGYLKILEELRKLDSSWSLIITPHGDAAVESNTQEQTGIYYRASRVSAKNNIHCSNRFSRSSLGCYPNLYADYMGENKALLFSRRPFMATFNDGNKNFTIIAAHVVFESPADLNTQNDMLKKTFDVNSLKELPTGINKQIYARFIETYITLQLIEKLKVEGLERIIYAGDFNLESQNPFWNYIFGKIPGSVLLVEGKTSISENRFVKGQESNGVSSNYDHFIMTSEDASKCRNAEVVNYLENDYSQKIREKYQVRIEGNKGPYPMDPNKDSLMSERTEAVKNMLKNYNFIIGKDGSLTPDTKTNLEDLKNFQDRMFESQLADDTYYKFFAQSMSDHLPIKMECQF